MENEYKTFTKNEFYNELFDCIDLDDNLESQKTWFDDVIDAAIHHGDLNPSVDPEFYNFFEFKFLMSKA